jgi:predicted HD phosphohydrolase
MDHLAETAAVLESLRGVWDEATVDELDHALQSAARAMADGADDELVLASALHDVARSPLVGAADDPCHDRVAQAWLTPRYGARVGWLAGAHVAAKRYLAATEPGYADALSAVSVATLRLQGGAGSDSEYVRHPWWPDAIRLRRYDDAAKNPHATSATISDVLTVAERVVQQSPWIN